MKYIYNKKRRAVILVLSLWMVLVLSLLAYSLAVEMQVEMKLTHGFRDHFEAEELARIGVARAIADIRNDRILDFSRNNGQGEVFDALGDVWTGSLTPRKYDIKGFGHYDLLVVDEASKIDLNNLNTRSLDLLKNLLLVLNVDDKKAQTLVEAIWDWKDPDDTPISLTAGPEETEISYYTMKGRRNGSFSNDGKSVKVVRPKNARFGTVDELLEVPGMTPELFYGYDPARETNPSFFPTYASKKHRPGLRDLVTVRSEYLNINTAGIEVMTALCACATQDLTSARSLAEKIITYRQQSRGKSINNNQAFRSIENLELVSGITPGFISLMKRAVPLLTIQSENFTIYCQAEVGKTLKQVYSSVSADVSDKPLPSFRVVVQCSRSVIVFEPDQFKKQKSPPGCRRAMETAVTDDKKPLAVDLLQWYVPVVYVERWISE